jgi:hypothetical protein
MVCCVAILILHEKLHGATVLQCVVSSDRFCSVLRREKGYLNLSYVLAFCDYWLGVPEADNQPNEILGAGPVRPAFFVHVALRMGHH